MTNISDVDKTIAKIKKDLQENEEMSLPKAAPTQHSIDNLSLMLVDDEQSFPSLYERPLSFFSHVEVKCMDCDFCVLPTLVEEVEFWGNKPISALAHSQTHRHGIQWILSNDDLQMGCSHTSIPNNRRTPNRFWKKLISIFKGEISVMVLGLVLGLSVVLAIRHFWGFEAWYLNWSCGCVGYWFVSACRSFWRWQKERLKRWVFCIGTPVAIWASIAALLGKSSWWGLLFAVLGSVLGYNLYCLWKKLKG